MIMAAVEQIEGDLFAGLDCVYGGQRVIPFQVDVLVELVRELSSRHRMICPRAKETLYESPY